MPIVKLTAITSPKWTKSIPNVWHNGKNNGVNITTALVVSINVPAINKIILITSKRIHLESILSVKNAPTDL